MATKRMFSAKIVCSDSFLDLPVSAQALYYLICMESDDDGFCNTPKKMAKLCGADSTNDIKALVDNKFILEFASGVVAVKHWFIHNTIRKDRHVSTLYTDEFKELCLDENGIYHKWQTNDGQMSDNCQTNDGQMSAQVRLDKVRLDKVRLDKNSIGRLDSNNTIEESKETDQPTFVNVLKFFTDILNADGAEARKFYTHYSKTDWHDSKGKQITNWKARAELWHKDQR